MLTFNSSILLEGTEKKEFRKCTIYKYEIQKFGITIFQGIFTLKNIDNFTKLSVVLLVVWFRKLGVSFSPWCINICCYTCFLHWYYVLSFSFLFSSVGYISFDLRVYQKQSIYGNICLYPTIPRSHLLNFMAMLFVSFVSF